MKHVCVVSSAHPWDDVRVASRIATAFLGADYRVTWVGPNIAQSANPHAGLESVDYRLFSAGRGRLHRLAGAWRARRLATQVAHVDWWYSPDPDMAGKLRGLARSKGGKTMFDVHENYHGGLLKRWFPGGSPPAIVREFLRHRIAATCRRVDLVIGVSASVLEPYCGQQPNNLVVRNLAPIWFAPERSENELKTASRMRIMHGKLSAGNGTMQVTAALQELSPQAQGSAQVVMLAVASTPEVTQADVLSRASRLPAGTLSTIPGVPHEQMADLMATCSVGLISYQRDLGYESLPNRLFEYMASGLAIIAPSYSPEIVRILETENIGLTADFESSADIARAIEWCVRNRSEVAAMGVRARKAYLAGYTWESEAERLIAAMEGSEAQ